MTGLKQRFLSNYYNIFHPILIYLFFHKLLVYFTHTPFTNFCDCVIIIVDVYV